MPDFQDFIAEFDKAGIIIEGRDKFIDQASSAANWAEAVYKMAYVGSKDGIRFLRTADDAPSNQEIDRILCGYPFDVNQRNAVAQNVITVG